MLFGSLPIGTKIYLENKKLINIEKLKVGDKLLSLKVDDVEINNANDFYLKYVAQNNNIEIDKMSFSAATVSNIYLIKDDQSNDLYNKTMYINNPVIARFFKNQCIVSHLSNILKVENNIIFDEENKSYKNFDNFKTFKIKSYKEDFLDTLFTDNNVEIDDNRYTEFNISPYYSISLRDNYFYFTEGMCLVGIVPEFGGFKIL